MKLDEFFDLKTNIERDNPCAWWGSSESFFKRDLLNGKGFIRLVRYYNSQFPHIEYGISDGSRYQGIMSKELPKYLNDCSKQGYDILLAVVRPNNIPSIKLLNKNNFVFFKNMDGKLIYIWNNLLKKNQMEIIIKEFLEK